MQVKGVDNIKTQYHVNALFNIQDYDEIELLEYIDTLINDIENNKNFTNEFKIALREKKIDMGYCPDCNVKLVSKSYKELHSELSELGHTPSEDIYYNICPECEEKY